MSFLGEVPSRTGGALHVSETDACHREKINDAFWPPKPNAFT